MISLLFQRLKINRLSAIPYVLAITICIFLLLPYGIYNLISMNTFYEQSLKKIEEDYFEYTRWQMKREILVLDVFFESWHQKHIRDAQARMDLILDSQLYYIEALVNHSDKIDISSIIHNSRFALPVYLSDSGGKLIAFCKNQKDEALVAELANPVTRKKRDDYIVVEKESESIPYRLGTYMPMSRVIELHRKNLIQFFQYYETSDLYFFLMNPDGKILVNKSRLFPGKQLAEDNAKKSAGTITSQLLESIHISKGVFLEFIWDIPDLPYSKTQNKMVYAYYLKKLDIIVGVASNFEGLEDYADDQIRDLKALMKKRLFEFLFAISLIFATILFTGLYFNRRSLKGFELFRSFFRQASADLKPIKKGGLSFDEFKELADLANDMVRDRNKQKKTILAYMNKLKLMNQKLKQMATRDGLTGVANRRSFDDSLSKSWNRALRLNKNLSIGMIDIDFFKQYNDTYGHQMGDTCLIRVAKALENEMKRPYDILARYGGEEFVILLPDTGSDGAKQIADRMKQAVEALNIPHSSSGADSKVTFSMGICTQTPSSGLSPQTLVQNADSALYRAKNEGRNKIVTFNSDDS